jgi:drug/metabolite transporter (DMT)-like permease
MCLLFFDEIESAVLENPMSTNNIDGVKAMWLAVIFFALGHSAVKWLPHLPFYQLVFLRALITASICVVVLRWRGESLIGRHKKLLFLRGLAGTIALTSYFYSLQHMPLATAVTFQHLSPLLTLLFAHLFLKEKTTAVQGAFFLLALVGVWMVKGFDPRIDTFALIISMVSVTASAAAYNLVRVLRSYDDELVVVLYFTAVTIPVVGPFAISTWVWPTLRDWPFILVMGVFTLLAQYYMTISYQKKTAADVAIYNYFGVLIAFFIGYFFFDEVFTPLAGSGMALILLAAVLSAQLSRLRARKI